MNRSLENVLDQERYDHYRLLVFAAHLLEADILNSNQCEEIDVLLNQFDLDFVRLYSVGNVYFHD